MSRHDFGKRLTELRERSGMNQQEVADKVGVSPAYLARLERGALLRELPGEKVIQRLADVLGAGKDELTALAGDVPFYMKITAKAGKTLALLAGSVGILISASLLIFGLLSLFKPTPMDSEGFLSTWQFHSDANYSALLVQADDAEINVGPWGTVHTFKIKVSSRSPSSLIFIGTANQSDIDSYLEGVSYGQIRLRVFPYFTVSTDRRNASAGSAPGDPVSLPFWVSTTHGTGAQTLVWELEPQRDSLLIIDTNGFLDADVAIAQPTQLSKISGFGYLMATLVLLPLSVITFGFGTRSRGFAGSV